MKIHDVKQGTREWLELRAGIPTASELDQILTPTGKSRTGEMPKSYCYRKLAEKWKGHPLMSFSGGSMEQGSILEDEAIPAFELQISRTFERVGFITTDDGRFGVSPDGFIANDCGLEVKCPQPTNHVRWLIDGGVPDEHKLQVYGGMFGTGLSRWYFVSYCRGFPMLVVEVNRDDAYMKAIESALENFYEAFDGCWSRLIQLNKGKEPKRRQEKQVTSDQDPFAVSDVYDVPFVF